MWLVALLLLPGQINPEAGKLLDQARRAEGLRARQYLQQVADLLRKEKEMPQRERQETRQELAKLLRIKAGTPAEVLEALGIDNPSNISRQILFRRYLEQWTIDHPVGLVVMFDFPRGEDPHIYRVILAP